MTYVQRMAAYAARAAELAAQDPQPALERVLSLLHSADHIIIGGAAGLSAAGGLDYHSEDVLRQEFRPWQLWATVPCGRPCGTRPAPICKNRE